MGHVGALVTVYCKLSGKYMYTQQQFVGLYTFSFVPGTWILDSPRKLHLSTSSSSSTPTSSDDVRCITEAGKLVWIGCGSSIYFVDAKTLEVKVTFHFCSNLYNKVGLSTYRGPLSFLTVSLTG